MYRRNVVGLAGLTLASGATGCLGTEPSGNAAAAQTPDPDHAIEIETRTDDPVETTVTVRRVTTGETVHNQTHTVQPNETLTAYNTRQADPDGIEEFSVSVAADDSTDSLTLETDQCWGDVLARVTESDGVDMVYAIC